MKVLEYAFLACCVFAASDIFAYGLIVEKVPPEGSVWSKTKWSLSKGSEPSDKIKPSLSDGVCLGGLMKLDVDAEIDRLMIPGRARLSSDGHKLKVANNLNMNFSDSGISLKNGAALEIGGMFETHMDFRSKVFNGISIDLEDSFFSVASVLSISLGNANISKDVKMGFSANLCGASSFGMGDFVVDPYLTDEKSNLFFALNFKNKANKFPVVSINAGDLRGVHINLNVDEKLPRGKYVFVSAVAKKTDFDGIRISINGQEYKKLGTKVKTSGRNLSVEKRKNGKNTDLILIVG